MNIHGPIPAKCNIEGCPGKPQRHTYYNFGFVTVFFCPKHHEECCEFNLDSDMARLDDLADYYDDREEYFGDVF